MPSIKKSKEKLILNELSSFIESLSKEAALVNERLNQSPDYSSESSTVTNVLELLTGLYFENDEVLKHWESIINLRNQLNNKLDRDIGYRVAILDYFSNLQNKLKNPKIIEIDQYQEIQQKAKIDQKTGLYNCSHFKELLEIELRKARRNNYPISVLFLDLDNFKEFNDINGHLTGDIYLNHVANIIKSTLRGEDIAARFGGDEYVVMLPYADKDNGDIVANRILKNVLANDISLIDKKIKNVCSISIGYSSYPIDGFTVHELLNNADKALFDAKRKGKNQVSKYNRKNALPTQKDGKNFRESESNKEININLNNSKNIYKAYIKNINEDGALLDIPYVVPLLQGVHLKGEINNDITNLQFSGKIVYTKKQGPGFLATVKFDDSTKDAESIIQAMKDEE